VSELSGQHRPETPLPDVTLIVVILLSVLIGYFNALIFIWCFALTIYGRMWAGPHAHIFKWTVIFFFLTGTPAGVHTQGFISQDFFPRTHIFAFRCGQTFHMDPMQCFRNGNPGLSVALSEDGH